MLKQIDVAEKPRILAPSVKRAKKMMLTIASTETLREVNQSRLAGILEKGLREAPNTSFIATRTREARS